MLDNRKVAAWTQFVQTNITSALIIGNEGTTNPTLNCAHSPFPGCHPIFPIVCLTG